MQPQAPVAAAEAPSQELAKNVLRLGWVSLLNDVGSEVLTRLVPFFVTGVLGASMEAVGLIEGIAESTATLLKPLFGRLSDRLGSRKGFVLWGYTLSAVARPLLALTGSWPEVAFLRFCDRFGKGVRTAPRDALIADSSLESKAGRSFGINRSLDTLGALIGVTAFGAWVAFHHETQLDGRTWIYLCLGCSVPGVLASLLVGLGISDIRKPSRTSASGPVPASDSSLQAARPLVPVLKRYLGVVALFSLANSSDAFILLRAKELQFTLAEILGMIALLNIVSAMTSIPAAALSDRLGRRALIGAGWVVYALAYGLLGSPISGNRAVFAATVAIYGLFFGFTEGVEKAWIADLAPSADRGRAYGIFGFVVGAVALPASFGFGWAWDRWGSGVPFLASAAIALFATSLLFALIPAQPRPSAQTA